MEGIFQAPASREPMLGIKIIIVRQLQSPLCRASYLIAKVGTVHHATLTRAMTPAACSAAHVHLIGHSSETACDCSRAYLPPGPAASQENVSPNSTAGDAPSSKKGWTLADHAGAWLAQSARFSSRSASGHHSCTSSISWKHTCHDREAPSALVMCLEPTPSTTASGHHFSIIASCSTSAIV